MHYHLHGLAATTEAAFCYRNKVIQQPAVAAASNLRLQSSHLKYKLKNRDYLEVGIRSIPLTTLSVIKESTHGFSWQLKFRYNLMKYGILVHHFLPNWMIFFHLSNKGRLSYHLCVVADFVYTSESNHSG